MFYIDDTFTCTFNINQYYKNVYHHLWKFDLNKNQKMSSERGLSKVILSIRISWLERIVNCVYGTHCMSTLPTENRTPTQHFSEVSSFSLFVSSPFTQMKLGWLTCMNACVCNDPIHPQRVLHRESVQGPLACQAASSHAEEPQWRLDCVLVDLAL